MTLDEIVDEWESRDPPMSAEELKLKFIENYSSIERSAQIHDESVFEIPSIDPIVIQAFQEASLHIEASSYVTLDSFSEIHQTDRSIRTELPVQWYRYRPRDAQERNNPYELLIRQIDDQNENLEDAEEYEIVARTTTSRSAKSAKTTDPVYVWAFQSSKPRAGGAFITYEVRMEENGDLRCNCPGWIFKKGTDRFCKHTKNIQEEAKRFHRMFKRGETLPTEVASAEQIERFNAGKKTTSNIGTFGRIIDLD